MDLIAGIKERRSIREFNNKDISESTLREIIDTARFYPSWKNTQTVRFIAVKSNLKALIAENAVMGFEKNKININGCNTLMVIATINGRSGYERDGNPTTSKGSHFQSFDAGLATEALVLSAYEKGVGSVILGIYDESKIKEILNIGDDMSISCIVAMGYYDNNPQAPKRKEIDEILKIV